MIDEALYTPAITGVCVTVMLAALLWALSHVVQYNYDRRLPDALAARDQQQEMVLWRNKFWTDVIKADDGNKFAHDIQYLVIRREPATTDEFAWLQAMERKIGLTLPDNGVFFPDGLFTLEGQRQIERFQRAAHTSGGNEPWTAEPDVPAVDESDPQFHKNFLRNVLGWPKWLIAWSIVSTILYASHKRQVVYKSGYRYGTVNRGWWLGITRVRRAYVRRTIIAILYAPTLLAVTAGYGLWKAAGLASTVPSRLRAWHAVASNPYRAEIRKARSALDVLREENADPALIASAEEQVALWMTRHEHETKKASDASAVSKRNARIQAARDTLLRLETEPVADDKSTEATEIENARRALDVLIRENADDRAIANATALVALLERRQADDAAKQKIAAAQDTLQRIGADAELDGIKPEPKRAPQPARVSNGS